MGKWILMAIGLALASWIAFGPASKPEREREVIPETTATAGTTAAAHVPVPASATRPPDPLPASKAQEVRNPEPPPAPLPEQPPGPEVVGTVLRDGQGTLLRTTQKEAARACAERGMHLPSIRELARLGKFRGAKGLMEVSQFRREDEAEGYVLIEATSPNGVKDSFYYSPQGYAPVDGETGKLAFWSSSLCIGCVIGGNEEHHNNSSHAFYGNGEIHDHYDDLSFAVRCVGSPK